MPLPQLEAMSGAQWSALQSGAHTQWRIAPGMEIAVCHRDLSQGAGAALWN